MITAEGDKRAHGGERTVHGGSVCRQKCACRTERRFSNPNVECGTQEVARCQFTSRLLGKEGNEKRETRTPIKSNELQQ